MRNTLCKTILFKAIPVLAFLFAASSAQAQNAYFKDKRVTILVNYAAGGPTDIEARVFARHLPKHITDSKGVIVQNMDGAGGLIGTNYLGEVAPKDGTVTGYLTGTAFQYTMRPKGRRVDYLKYSFVAYQPGTSVYFMRTDIAPGMKSSADILKARQLVVGGLGVDNAKDILLRLTMDMLGVKYGYVTSYKGSQGARLALQRGEINVYSESPPSYRAVIMPNMVSRGEVLPLFYDPTYDGENFKDTMQMAGLDVPPFHEFYKRLHDGKLPEGKLWEAYKAVISLNGAMQRMIVMPPGAPDAAIAAMREAVTRLNADKAYADDALKTFGFVPEWTTTGDVAQRVRKNLVLSPGIRKFLNDYIANPPRNR